MNHSTAPDQRRISEMCNRVPTCEEGLNSVGVYTADQVLQLGVEGTFLKMREGRKRQGRKSDCCNAAYLDANYGAIPDIDWRDIPEKQRIDSRELTAGLRQSGGYA